MRLIVLLILTVIAGAFAMFLLRETLSIGIIIVLVLLIVFLMVVIQLAYFVKFYQEDEAALKEEMTPCINCEAPLYPEDEICPYCKIKQT